MANIDGLFGANFTNATPRIFAAYGNDLVNLTTGNGYHYNLSSGNKAEFAMLLDYVFFQNFVDRPFTLPNYRYVHVRRTPYSKYIYTFKNRIFLGYIKYGAPQQVSGVGVNGDGIFPSRVQFSDLGLGINKELTWGMEWGSNLKNIINTPYVMVDQSAGYPAIQNFINTNIKVGDPFFITDSGDSTLDGQYFIESIENPFMIKLTKPLTGSVSVGDTSFYTGSNWFDVGNDDGDYITGFGDNNDRLLIFKVNSLYFYTGSQLKKVTDAPGTSSQRSVVNKGQYTYYFHGSSLQKTGIYRYDGVQSVKVSRAIEPFIRGMSASNYTEVVAWEEGDEVRFYLGDLANANREISMTNAVATYHTANGAWDVSPIADVIKCATTYISSNQEDSYTGNSEGQVLKMASGNNHNGDPIRLNLETKIYYPNGTDVLNDFTKIQAIGRQQNGIKVRYKLWDKPNEKDNQWQPLGELSGDRKELSFPIRKDLASGIQLQFSEYGTLENDLFVEKIGIYSIPKQIRVVK